MYLIKKWIQSSSALRMLLNMYPPLLGAGIRTRYISRDFKQIEVEMNLKWFNRNYVGTHYGGSLYSMVDPFFMIMFIKNLGPDYVVWDQSAKIHFLSPGKGKVGVTFHITDEDIEKIRRSTEKGEKYKPVFHAQVLSTDGRIIAEVEKTLYIKRKSSTPNP